MDNETKKEKPEAEAQEPSMEDILTSIRRILSEENEGDARSSAAAVDASAFGGAAKPDADSLGDIDVGDVRSRADEVADPSREVAGGLDLESEETRQAVSEAAAPLLELTPDMRIGKVVSSPTKAASEDVLAELAKAILDRRDMAVGGRDVTLESMVREMLRPLLREWLDRNLPYLIERLVRKEIDSMINRAERLED